MNRQLVLAAAVDLADKEGLAALTMRNLADELGVEAMSLYYHLPNKEAILDGVVEVVVDEILGSVGELGLSDPTTNWKADLRATILTARSVLLSHPWIPPVIETRASLSLPVITYFETLLRLMRQGGLSYDIAHHGLHTLGSRAMGFSQELFKPDDAAGEEDVPDVEAMAGAFPYLAGMLGEISHDPADPNLGWCDDQTEFEFAIDLLLDGLDRMRDDVR